MTASLQFTPVHDHPHLLSESVLAAIPNESGILVTEIDPQYMNGHDLANHYGLDPDSGANCMIVRGKRDGVYQMAAVLVPVGTRADLNGIVCETLGVKKVSFAPLDDVLRETGMEYGSITPVGLPSSYTILIDRNLMQKETIIVGGGKQISKLLVPTVFLSSLPNVQIIDGLAQTA